MVWALDFVASQFAALPYPDQDCSGKTVIVTGSNIGLGFETAQHFVRLKASKVILAVRSEEKGQAAKEQMEKATKQTGVIEVWPCDYGSYDSMRKFMERVDGLDRVDIFIANSGLLTRNWSMVQGHESHVAVNFISTYYLLFLAVPILRKSAKKYNIVPHLTFTSSFVQFLCKFKERQAENILTELDKEKGADMSDRYLIFLIIWISAYAISSYNVSKTLGIFCAPEFAQRLQKSDDQGHIIFNHVDPGWVVTFVGSFHQSLPLTDNEMTQNNCSDYAGPNPNVHQGHSGLAPLHRTGQSNPRPRRSGRGREQRSVHGQLQTVRVSSSLFCRPTQS